jgi:peptide/nickel transport system permease protein
VSRGLLRYIARRLALAIFVLLAVVTLTFIIARVVPSDPAELYVGPKATEAQRERARVELGLDKPLYVQYASYLEGLLTGNWGISLRAHTSVLSDILTYLPATLEIIILANIIAVLAGIPLGVYSAVKKGSWLDQVGRLAAISGVSIPSFWFALLLQLVFFGTLHLLPLEGRLGADISLTFPIKTITGFYTLDSLLTLNIVGFVDSLRHLILPAIALATYPIGLITRMTRSMMIEVLRETYIKFARANGILERVIIFRHALKNAIIPTLTVLGLSFAYSITGAVLIEIIFGWPGLGTYTLNAIIEADYPAILGVTIFGTMFYIMINLALDVAQSYIDPRVRLA